MEGADLFAGMAKKKKKPAAGSSPAVEEPWTNSFACFAGDHNSQLYALLKLQCRLSLKLLSRFVQSPDRPRQMQTCHGVSCSSCFISWTQDSIYSRFIVHRTRRRTSLLLELELELAVQEPWPLCKSTCFQTNWTNSLA